MVGLAPVLYQVQKSIYTRNECWNCANFKHV